ncbi:hypothetical protein GCM10020358_58180 [Amorphoplanes nipponensis]|uniref:MarR family transcriptional regulator n=1 Tax=Actinoplanes nipponensis TaxID=135950 RepID=UPI00337A3063
MTTPTTPAAVTVANTLAAHPDGITTRALADASGVSASTVAKTLTAMEADGTATRTPGPANGNRKTADIWHPATTPAPADEAPADETPADATPAPADATPADETPADATATPADETPADETPADATPAPADETPADATATPADETPADETPADATPAPADETPADATATPADETPADETPADETPADAEAADAAAAPVSGAPVGPRQPDLKVLIMAGVLGGHPDGITADAAINESGLSVAMGDTILAAMEVTGAARRLPTEADGTELWVPVADADLTKVDPANAPTHTTCPTCGHTRKIRRPSARRAAATTGTGRTTGEINTDGSAKLAKNGLRNQVEAFMRDLGTGHDVTPGTVARELGGRSSGAVANSMARLTEPGVLVMTSEAPVKYALAETAPAPTAEVVAFMTRPLTDDEPATAAPADTDAASTDNTTGDDTADAGTDTTAATTTTDKAAAPADGDAASTDNATSDGTAEVGADTTAATTDEAAATGATTADDEAAAAPIAA